MNNYNHNCEDCTYECNHICPFELEEYESLIIDAAKDIADLTREVVGLRFALKVNIHALKKKCYLVYLII